MRHPEVGIRPTFPVTIAPCVSQLSSAHRCEDPRLAMIREGRNKKSTNASGTERKARASDGMPGPASAYDRCSRHSLVRWGSSSRTGRVWRANGESTSKVHAAAKFQMSSGTATTSVSSSHNRGNWGIEAPVLTKSASCVPAKPYAGALRLHIERTDEIAVDRHHSSDKWQTQGRQRPRRKQSRIDRPPHAPPLNAALRDARAITETCQNTRHPRVKK